MFWQPDKATPSSRDRRRESEELERLPPIESAEETAVRIRSAFESRVTLSVIRRNEYPWELIPLQGGICVIFRDGLPFVAVEPDSLMKLVTEELAPLDGALANRFEARAAAEHLGLIESATEVEAFARLPSSSLHAVSSWFADCSIAWVMERKNSRDRFDLDSVIRAFEPRFVEKEPESHRAVSQRARDAEIERIRSKYEFEATERAKRWRFRLYGFWLDPCRKARVASGRTIRSGLASARERPLHAVGAAIAFPFLLLFGFIGLFFNWGFALFLQILVFPAAILLTDGSTQTNLIGIYAIYWFLLSVAVFLGLDED